MKLPQAIKKILFWGAIYYTVITVFLSLICVIMNDEGNVLTKPERFLEVFLFSFIAATASVVYYENILPRTLGIAIHFLGYVGGFFFCLVLPSKSEFSSSVVIMCIYTIVYAILSALIITSRKKKLKSDARTKPQNISPKLKEKPKKSEYVSQFKSTDENDKT